MSWITQVFSKGDCHKRAFEEVFVVTVFSLVPLLLLPFLEIMKAPKEAQVDLLKVLLRAVEGGQLFLYALSIFGTLIWLCVEDVSEKQFPPRKYLATAAILPAFLCLGIFSSDPLLAKPINPFLVDVSAAIYVFYLLLYYVLLVFKFLRAPDVKTTLDAGVERLMGQHKSRAGGQP